MLLIHAFIALIVICFIAAGICWLLIVLIWIAKNYNALWSAI